MSKEALKLALEALDKYGFAPCDKEEDWQGFKRAITAIKEALAQTEQEPVAYIHRNEYNEYRLEPHDSFDIKSIPFNVDVSLFKLPQRKPLTDEEVREIANQYALSLAFPYDSPTTPEMFARAIEAAHGIKGDA